eukprot:CAMPEP_0204479290 /NCGR_PEP_ID=MMETSP0471-20130131/33983_1 /ASSEMBLY_ACC=CAM_ASM_000602 /TAXON_ID=2969 /ORGANISM="Oxyrrhis marina" /LENGTH=88 /DNA_ID=CAMNT_0051482201 /DNA_START=246 /DNA_END=510 /DNA_ORIENTATION=+
MATPRASEGGAHTCLLEYWHMQKLASASCESVVLEIRLPQSLEGSNFPLVINGVRRQVVYRQTRSSAGAGRSAGTTTIALTFGHFEFL